jgi:hypothetical protein
LVSTASKVPVVEFEQAVAGSDPCGDVPWAPRHRSFFPDCEGGERGRGRIDVDAVQAREGLARWQPVRAERASNAASRNVPPPTAGSTMRNGRGAVREQRSQRTVCSRLRQLERREPGAVLLALVVGEERRVVFGELHERTGKRMVVRGSRFVDHR